MLLAAMFILGGLCFAGLGIIALCTYAEIIAIKKQSMRTRTDLLQMFLMIKQEQRRKDQALEAQAQSNIDANGNVKVNLN